MLNFNNTQNLRLMKLNLLKKKFILDIQFINLYIRKKKIIQKKIYCINNIKKKHNILLNKEQIKFILNKLNIELKFVNKFLNQYFYLIPNITDFQVHYGLHKSHNLIVNEYKLSKQFNFHISNYIKIGLDMDGFDFKNATKITQSHFSILKKSLAKLNRILIQFMLNIHTIQNKYDEINIPYLVNKICLYNTGQLPKFNKELFFINTDKLYLIPTAEVSLMNLFSNKCINKFELPIKTVAYSSCFRNEQCYGIVNTGLLRNKQFDKVELTQIVKSENSNLDLELITYHAEKILILLKLPYRKVLLCSQETSFASYKTYDLEVWFPSLNQYYEISSCSNMLYYQSNRLNLKYKYQNKIFIPHTLNASGLAVGRLLAAIIENYQQKDGSILIPKILIPFYKKKKIF